MEASKTTMFVLANGHDRSKPVTRFIFPPNWNAMRVHGSIARYYGQRWKLITRLLRLLRIYRTTSHESIRERSRLKLGVRYQSLIFPRTAPHLGPLLFLFSFVSFSSLSFSSLITFLTSHRLPSHCYICNAIYVSYPMVITLRTESSWYGRFKYDVYQLLHDRITSIEQRVEIRSSKCTYLLGVVD